MASLGNLSGGQLILMKEAQVRTIRRNLRQAIFENSKAEDSLLTNLTKDLMASGTCLNQRYKVLDCEGLISKNSQSLVALERLPIGLGVLEKYGRHLLRPLHQRTEQWRIIKFMNPIFAERVDTIQGGRDIIQQLGYNKELEDGFSFPEGVEPDPDNLLHLLADILLAKREVDCLIHGDHPNPQQLNQFLSQRCLLEISQIIAPVNVSQHQNSPNPSATSMAPAPVIQFQRGQTPAEAPEISNSEDSCDICGENQPEMICYVCNSKQLCVQCDLKWHRHPQRQSHNRTQQSRPISNLAANRGNNNLMVKEDVPVTTVSTPSHTRPTTVQDRQFSNLEAPDQSSPKSSNDSFHSTNDGSTNNNIVPTLDNTAESGAVMANMLPLQQQQNQGASQILDEDPSDEMFGGSSAAGDFIPPPLPAVFRTISYKSPKMEIKRQIAALEDKIKEKQDALHLLLISSPSFADDPLYINLTREKDLLVRKNLELYGRLKAMRVSSSGDEEVYISSPRSQCESTNSQPVSYPPSITPHSTRHSSEIGVGVPTVPSYEVQNPYQFQTMPHSQTHYSDNNEIGKGYPLTPYSNYGRNQMKQQQHCPSDHPVFTPPLSNWETESSSNENIPSDPSSGRRNSSPPYNKTLQFDDFWECEHCTTINSPGSNICGMCFKTSDDPKFVPNHSSVEMINSNSSGPDLSAEEFEQIRTELKMKTLRVYEEYDEIAKLKKEAHERDALLRGERELEGRQNAENDEKESKLEEPGARATLHDHRPKSDESFGKQFEPGETQKSSLKDSKSLETIKEEATTKQLYNDGNRLVSFLKRSDESGYSFDEFDIAMMMCGDHDPIDWLKLQWEKMIEKVVSKTTTKGRNQSHNCVGELSRSEAREHLRQTKGDVDKAVESCVKERSEKFERVMAYGPFSREDTLLLMNAHQGEVLAVVTELQRRQLQPYLERIWENLVGSVSDALALEASNEITLNSVIDHEDFQVKILDKGISLERRIRMVFVEGKLQSWQRAKAVIEILTDMPEENFSLHDVIEAIRSCAQKPRAILYLQQECQACFCKYPMSKIENFTFCQCKLCSDCFNQHIELVIREKFVQNWVCPICQQPDIQDNDQIAEEHFAFLEMLLTALIKRSKVSKESRDLFQEKLRDWRLMKDPNFRWCAHCGNGFIFNFNGRDMKMECSSCEQSTCFKCKRQWESQHEGISCEDFERWKAENNPENQALGLDRHLAENGIVCPGCNMRYALAKGGCMHFKCPQCGHEFCCGCYMPFKRAENCKKFESCQNIGLHSHHPRDCFFYLRDNTVEELQSLLQKYKVEYNTDPPEAQEDGEKCPVILQKEQSGGRADEPCGSDVLTNHSGLCLSHYKEYLVSLINKKRLDPVVIMSVEKIHNLLSKLEVNIPAQRDTERQQHYLKRIVQYVKEKVPLPRRGSVGNVG